MNLKEQLQRIWQSIGLCLLRILWKLQGRDKNSNKNCISAKECTSVDDTKNCISAKECTSVDDTKNCISAKECTSVDDTKSYIHTKNCTSI